MQTVQIALATRAAFGAGEQGQERYEAAVAAEIALRHGGEKLLLNGLPELERVQVLRGVLRRLEPQIALTDRLMRAADALLHHGEYISCDWVRGDGLMTECRLVGRGHNSQTVILQRWCDAKRSAPVPFASVVITQETAARLESIAVAQDEAAEAQKARDRTLMSGVFTVRGAVVAKNEGGHFTRQYEGRRAS